MNLSGGARIAGVMGWPVAHSRSPALHGYWLAEHKIDGAYVPMLVAPENLAAALRALPVLGFAGCNLTLPHKETALAIVDEIDPSARRAGAANTIVVGKDGKLGASNSDMFGFLAALHDGAPGWRAHDGPAVVIGGGGGARSVAAALLDAGVPELRLVNRTRDRAEAMARELGGSIVVLPWQERAAALEHASLLVQTTSLGLEGRTTLDLPLDRLPREAVVNDIVYVPLETPLLAAARARGNRVVDGLGMLLHQGRPGFAAWYGVMPEVTPALRRAMLATFAR
ncbi:MAG TPA: shikimate dehydrogenase [Stellaceae bacterium]|nr:shikimate dehydrogenase [Stellaceae bacterium]